MAERCVTTRHRRPHSAHGDLVSDFSLQHSTATSGNIYNYFNALGSNAFTAELATDT